jgi:hypothetical protein
MYFENNDAYFRRSAYGCISKIYKNEALIRKNMLRALNSLSDHSDCRIRQTVVNTAYDIRKTDFETVRDYFDNGRFDPHNAPRNALIGSIKKMGKKKTEIVRREYASYLCY